MTVLLDFESVSRADLRAVGGRNYWRDPSTRALVVVWYDVDADEVGVWSPGQVWPHDGRVLVAHNASGFDRFGGDRYGWRPTAWLDSSQWARKAGLPGALDALGIRWCGVPKDKAASEFTRSLSSVRRPVTLSPTPLDRPCPRCGAVVGAACVALSGKRANTHAARAEIGITPSVWASMPSDERRAIGRMPVIDAAAMSRVTTYCASDVEIMARAWDRLRDWRHVDADVEQVDRVINDRGVRFDADLARLLIEHDARNADAIVEEVAAEMHARAEDVRAAASSPQKFCATTGAPDAQADTVEALDHPLTRARQALASIASGKLRAGLARVSPDGRLRDLLRYYGAHTGRWSSVGMQLHNMPRPDKSYEDLPIATDYPYTESEKGERVIDVDAFAAQVLDGRACNALDVALLVRATLCAAPGCVLVVRDYSAIEARATAYAASDVAALDVFRSGRDPYKVAASAIFGAPYEAVEKWQRQIGKVAELALGYQGGPNAFEKMARAYKIDPAVLAKIDLRSLVARWRGLHAAIKALWYRCESAFRSAMHGTPAHAGPFEYARDEHGAVACFLPSGRPIVYNEPTDTDGLQYVGTKGREYTYGGKLVENAVQGMCRDMLAEALCIAERDGLHPVLHVHDEIVCEVPTDRAAEVEARLHEIMTTVPTWAPEFPLAASGWVGERYRK
jgi:DNA polymerase